MKIKQEFNDSQHRLVNEETGKSTKWAGYRSFTVLDGFVGFTAFYGEKEGVLPCEKFCEMVGVSV